jgi:uncharacterized protein YkwD
VAGNSRGSHHNLSESQSNAKAVILQASDFLLQTINADRATHHVGPLVLNKKLSKCGLTHSVHMSQLGTLTHDQFTQDLCIAHTFGGENVGEASGDLNSALTAIHHIMLAEGPCPHPSCPGSEFEAHGHYVNLVNGSFHKVGIGIFVSGDGTTWLTEDFTN